MARRRTQIVIGIAVLVLSVAFLLVGIYFADLQGIIFQNGSNSLQLFADNMGAVVNSLYSAPSGMSISLSGNSSVCTWQPAIGAYTCNGGSKIYNLSYATGPTLDSGKNIFSVAVCFLVATGPPGTSKAKQATSATETATEVTDSSAEAASEAAQVYSGSFDFLGEDGNLVHGTYIANSQTKLVLTNLEQTLSDDDLIKLSEAISGGLSEINPAFSESSVAFHLPILSLEGEVGAQTLSTFFKDTSDIQDAEFLPKLDYIPPDTIDEIVSSGDAATANSLSLLSGLRKVGIGLLVNYGVPLTAFWLASNSKAIASGISSFSGSAGAVLGQALSGLSTLGPLSKNQIATAAYAENFFQSLSAANSLSSLPNGLSKVIAENTAANEVSVERNALTELALYGASSNTSNPYSTPIGGESVPSEISSKGSFAGPAYLGSSSAGITASALGDPLLSTIFADSQTAFLVYGRTASCLGTLPEAFNANSYTSLSSDFSNGASIVGALTTLINVYAKANVVDNLGTYFVGYGGEAYVTGESSGRPTTASAPVISDMSDLCSMAQSASVPGEPLKSLLNPLQGGDINFSISQGLYNTMCSPQSQLYPVSFGQFFDNILNSKSPRNVSILLPPQYAISFSNSSGDNAVCLSNVLTDLYGSPIISQTNVDGSNYLTEYGLPDTCINISAQSSGEYNINFNTSMEKGAKSSFSIPSEIGKNAFFLINQNEIGFSIPPSAYSTTGENFIGGQAPSVTLDFGVDSPVVGAIANALGGQTPRLQIGLSTAFAQLDAALGLTGFIAPNSSFYQTDYANVTFEVTPTTTANGGTNLSVKFISNKIIFGVFPNSNSTLGGLFKLSGEAKW